MIKKYKESFLARIITLVLLPIVVVSVVLILATSIKLSNTLKSEALDKLKALSYAIQGNMEALAGNGIRVEGEGEEATLYAGTIDMTFLNQVFDYITEKTGMYVTVFYGDTRVLTSVKSEGKRALGTRQTDTEVTSTVLSGGEYFSMSTMVVGTECIVSYIPLRDNNSKVIGMVFAGIPKATVMKEVKTTAFNSVMIALGVLAIVAAIALISVRLIGKAVVGVSDVCHNLAQGNFTITQANIGEGRSDAVGRLVRNINNLKASFVEIISGVKENITVMVTSSSGLDEAAEDASLSMGELSNAVEGIANGATTQAQEVESSAREVAAILTSMEGINDSVAKTEESASSMEKNSKAVVANFEVLLEDTKKSVDKLNDIIEKMKHVQDAVETVTTAANDINSIASQTNLLSLNASIEAARAGDAGRGFAVVAGEISTLADQSNAAAVKIRNIMDNLKGETEGAVAMVKDMSGMMDKQEETGKQSQVSLSALIEEIDNTRNMVGAVKTNADEIQSLCNGLNDNITSLSAISQENAASAEETSASIIQISEATKNVREMSEQMKGVAKTLEDLTAHFKIV